MRLRWCFFNLSLCRIRRTAAFTATSVAMVAMVMVAVVVAMMRAAGRRHCTDSRPSVVWLACPCTRASPCMQHRSPRPARATLHEHATGSTAVAVSVLVGGVRNAKTVR